MNIMRRIPWVSDDPSTLIDLNKTGLPNLGGPDKQGTRAANKIADNVDLIFINLG